MLRPRLCAACNNHRHNGSGSGYHDPSGEDPCTRSEENGFRGYQSGRYGGGGYRSNNNMEVGGFFRRSTWDSGDLAGGGSSSASRWRESCHSSRDVATPPMRRLQSNNHRNNGSGSGYHVPSGEDPCTRSEDNGFRSYHAGRYGGGGYRSNNNREVDRFFRRSSWDSGDLSRQNHEPVASQASAIDPLAHPSSQGLSGSDNDVDRGMRTGQRQDRDMDHSLGSLSWKPLKWNRSGSFSSSSKTPKPESEEKKLEVAIPPGKDTPVDSPVSSPLSPEDGMSRKKQRLGWGQGLAKYERAKTEATDEVCVGLNSNCDDASPRVLARLGSTSPATPASLTCSSLHGGDEKMFSEVANNDAAKYVVMVSGDEFRLLLEELSIIPECLELYSSNSSFSLFPCSLLPEEICDGDSACLRPAAMRKLLSVKDQVLKQIEKTESDIDSFENELKKLKSDIIDGQVLSTLKQPENIENDTGRESTQFSAGLSQSLDEQIVASPKVNGSSVAASPAESNFRESIPMEKVPSNPNTSVEVLGRSRSAMQDAELTVSLTALEKGDDVDLGKSESTVPAVDYAKEFQSLTTSIITSNQEQAKKAALDVRYSGDPSAWQTSVSHDNFSDQDRELLIKKKIGVRKCNMKIKEKVLALKYKALLHLWKEDLQSTHFKKQRPKAHRKIELGRSSQHVVQKCRSLLRARDHPVGGSPAPEIMEFAGKLLADSQARIHRNYLRMPAMIIDEGERARSRFITNNGLVEDPAFVEKERSLTNPWTPEERKIFIEMLALYGKDFSKIRTFLDHKTTADCVEFYYKHHKSEDFAKVRKSLGLRKPSAATRGFLVTTTSVATTTTTSSKKWKREVNGLSQSMSQRPRHAWAEEEETCAADVLVRIMAVERRLPSEVSETVEDSSLDDGNDVFCSGDWTDEEKSLFVAALASNGRDFVQVSRCVGSRSAEQCRVFFSKARKSLALDGVLGRASLSEETASATCQTAASPVRTGDVKLFGQVLTRPRSPENPNAACGLPDLAGSVKQVSLSREEETWRSGVGR
ncbi:duplicated homeodomain-like superfamily protein isoform X2 [Wolffia australiana]